MTKFVKIQQSTWKKFKEAYRELEQEVIMND